MASWLLIRFKLIDVMCHFCDLCTVRAYQEDKLQSAGILKQTCPCYQIWKFVRCVFLYPENTFPILLVKIDKHWKK